ncbi:hypothetical protein DSECCO2_595820 [anaerobic digester metagenome]
MLLPETDDCVDEKEGEYDREGLPVPDDGGYDDRRLDHPGDGAPEVAEELQDLALLFLDDLIGAELLDAALRLGLAETSLPGGEGQVEVVDGHTSGFIGADLLALHHGLPARPLSPGSYISAAAGPGARCEKAGRGMDR